MPTPIAEAFVRVFPDVTKFAGELVKGLKTEIAAAEKSLTAVKVKLLLDPKAIEAIKAEVASIPTVVPVKLLVDPKAIEAIKAEISSVPTVVPIKLLLDPKSAEALRTEIFNISTVVKVRPFIDPKSIEELQLSLEAKVVPISVKAVLDPKSLSLLLDELASAPAFVNVHTLAQTTGLREDIRLAASTAGGEVPVAIVPSDLPAFRGLIESVLTTPPVPVTLIPADLATFRAALEAELATLPIGVPIAPQVAPGSAVAASAIGSSTASGSVASESAVAARIASAEAQRQIKAQGELEVLSSRRLRINEALTGSLKTVADADRNLNAAVKLSEDAIRLRVALDTEETRSLERLTQGLIKNAAAEKEKALASKQAATAVGSGGVVTEEQRAAQLAALSSAASTRLQHAVEFKPSSLVSPRTGALQAVKEATKAATAADEVYNAALLRQIPAELESSKAILDNATALVGQREQVYKDIVAQEQLIKQTERAAAQQAKNTALLGRGAGSTALTFGGLRGATLAASKEFLIGAAAASILAKSIGAFSAFEETINTFGAVTGVAGKQLGVVADEAKRLGNDITLPAVSASSAAVAMTELAKAGLSVKDSMAAARGALQLATAAGVSTGDAVQLVATALNSFGLAGSDATHVADVFASAANAAQGNITDFGIALSQSAAVSHQAGVSFEDTLALLALFARNGLKGSDAGTSLRTALIKLIAPTKQADAAIQGLGIKVRDLQGNVRPDVFAQFGQATSNFTPKARDFLAAIIGGTDAIRAIAIGAREGVGGLTAMQQALAKQGEAARVAEGRTKGLAGTTEAFKNSAATFGIQVGSAVAPAVEHITKAATTAVEQFQSLGSEIGSITSHAGLLGTAFTGIAKAFGSGITPVIAIVAALKAFNLVQGLSQSIGNKYKGTTKEIIADESLLTKTRVKLSEATQALVLGTTEAAAAQIKLTRTELEGTAATLEKSIASKRSAVKSTGFTAFATGANVAVGAALLLGTAISLIGKQETETQQATDALAHSIDLLNIAMNPHNFAAFNKAIDDLQTSALQEALTNATHFDPNAGGVRTGGARVITDTAKAQAAATETSVKAIRKLAATINDPALKHDAFLFADFIHLLGRQPTSAEKSFILHIKTTGTSINDVLNQLPSNVPGLQAAEDVLKAQRARIEALIGTPLKPKFANIGGDESDIFHVKDVLKSLPQLERQITLLFSQFSKLKPGDKGFSLIREQIIDLFKQLGQLGPEAQASGLELGKKLIQSLAKGMTAEQEKAVHAAERAVAAATQAVSDAITNGQKQVTDSINSAKTNLGSLTGGLASAVGQVLDARAQKAIADLDKSALGKEIVALQNSLDKSNVVGQRASLKFSIATATDESSRRNAQLQLVQFNLQTKLATDQKELQSKKDTIQKVEAAQKESITRQLNAYANEFATGKITFEAFQNDIVKILGKHENKFGDTGKLLGGAFAAAFNAQVAAVLDQASALVGFVQKTKGGTTQFSLTHPAETLAAANRAIQEAKTAREETLQTLKETRDAIKSKNNNGTNGLLTSILAALEGKKKTTRTNGTVSTIPGGITITTTTTRIGGKIK